MRLLRASGLGSFVTQHRVELDGEGLARLDFAWVRQKVALERDGYRYHSAPSVFSADRVRGNAIELAGWLLLRTTPSEVRDQPSRLLAPVRRALELRERTLRSTPEPATAVPVTATPPSPAVPNPAVPNPAVEAPFASPRARGRRVPG